ncbi:hypothetical protein FHW36_103217 [Chitinophaga polysaccharea]|uniref:Uncharacterized protein n=1 Tax=Chitinophaga polysaccharea TaxID=1293035 RepID=A0A561PTJ4_9BACT|nr:hypothetical protein FHW36_103217 [Chitinophaga polysaccharea]
MVLWGKLLVNSEIPTLSAALINRKSNIFKCFKIFLAFLKIFISTWFLYLNFSNTLFPFLVIRLRNLNHAHNMIIKRFQLLCRYP